jgi:hypothetical protein
MPMTIRRPCWQTRLQPPGTSSPPLVDNVHSRGAPFSAPGRHTESFAYALLRTSRSVRLLRLCFDICASYYSENGYAAAICRSHSLHCSVVPSTRLHRIRMYTMQRTATPLIVQAHRACGSSHKAGQRAYRSLAICCVRDCLCEVSTFTFTLRQQGCPPALHVQGPNRATGRESYLPALLLGS